jgi:hypothetical protein
MHVKIREDEKGSKYVLRVKRYDFFLTHEVSSIEALP